MDTPLNNPEDEGTPSRGFEPMEMEGPPTEDEEMPREEEETGEPDQDVVNPTIPHSWKSSWNRHIRLSTVGALLFLVVVAGVAISGIPFAGGSSNGQAQDSVNTPATDAPAVKVLRRKERFKEYLIVNNISDNYDLATRGTPQQRALDFMVAKNWGYAVVLPSGNDEESYSFLTKYVMVVLYYSTDGARWNVNPQFLREGTVCDWNVNVTTVVGEKSEEYGVFCDEQDQIEFLHLPQNSLEGTLPEELGLLTTLKILNLKFNSMSDKIPDSFKGLVNLEKILLLDNQITGSIPSWIGTLQNLSTIGLSHNQMTGHLPTSLGSLVNLEGIALDNNLFTGSFAGLFDTPTGLSKLKKFYADHNQFGGPLEDTFLQNLNELEDLDLSNNYFIGSIPRHLFENTGLKVLDLHDNNFDSMPVPFPENTNLTMLALQKCKFTAQAIPSSISNLKALQHLDLSQNKFTGDIPTQIGAMNMTYLFLAENDFVPGPVPTWIESLTNLVELDLKSTKRTGTIPSFIGRELKNLVLLDLDNNLLEGEIPSSLGDLPNLNILLLNRNNLTSTLPDSMKNLTELKLFFLDANTNITGSLGDIFCNNSKFPMKPVIVAGCDLCEAEASDCCTSCCQPGEECNPEVFVPDMDPIWELGFQRVFFTFGRDDFFITEKQNLTGYEDVQDWLQHSNVLRKNELTS